MSPAEVAKHRRRNVFLLALCQAAGMSSASLMISVTALVGAQLAPDVRLATLPLALQWLAVMLLATPASFLMKHQGRRLGLSLSAVFGIFAGLGDLVRELPAVLPDLAALRSLCGRGPVLSLRGSRRGRRGLQKPGDLLGAGRRRNRRDPGT